MNDIFLVVLPFDFIEVHQIIELNITNIHHMDIWHFYFVNYAVFERAMLRQISESWRVLLL